MPHPNRVDPYGQRHAVPDRGLWFGNRGLLHNDRGEFVREWKVKRWIICELEFKGWHRKLLQPGQYTELFFMDEATALSAGHRPCMECRREAAKAFLDLAGYRRVGELDDKLHEERFGPKPTVEWRDLPDGAMVDFEGSPYLMSGGQLRPWTFSGYGDPVLPNNKVTLITPPTTISVLRRGYNVTWRKQSDGTV